MNYVKIRFACMVITSMLLSTAQCNAWQWGMPDSSTWQRAKEYAGSYITPAWQEITNNALTIGGTALSALPQRAYPASVLLAPTLSAIAPLHQLTSRQLIRPQERPPKSDYFTTAAWHTLAAVLPTLMRLYQAGKIDSRILSRLLADPVVLATAGASAGSTLAAAGLEWLYEPIDEKGANSFQLEKRLLELKELLQRIDRRKEEWQNTHQKEIVRLNASLENELNDLGKLSAIANEEKRVIEEEIRRRAIVK